MFLIPTPFKLYFCSLLFFSMFVFLGPFDYYIYSKLHFIEFYVYQFIFAFGLLCGGLYKHKRKQQILINKFYMANKTEHLCLLLNIFAIIFFILEIKMIISSVNTVSDFSFLSSYYGAIVQSKRSLIDRLFLIMMHLGGEVVFLIVNSMHHIRHNILNKSASICLWLPGVYYILQGSRFMLAVEFLIFIFTFKYKYKIFNCKQKVMLCAIGCSLLIFFLILFDNRQIYFTPITKYHFYPGDMPLKAWAMTLYNNINILKPFYELCDYLGQAPYVYAYYMEFFPPQDMLYGLNLLRPINLFLNIFNSGINIHQLVQAKIFASGKYSGFCYPLIVDFGYLGSFIVALLMGFIMSRILIHREHNLYARCIAPCIIVSILFAPVYYFNVGRLDFIVILTLGMSVILKPFIKIIPNCKESRINYYEN